MNSPTTKRKLPPGVRFHPTKAELILRYLLVMVSGEPLESEFVVEVDIYKFYPAALKALAYFSEELNWYFFCSAGNKYKSGKRKNRAAPCGYWKPTGEDKEVINGNKLVGHKKTLVFYEGKPAEGVKTDWVMHEYRLEASLLEEALRKAAELGKDAKPDAVVCKIFNKGGLGPRNGEQFGAAYNEEDWNNALEPITEHGQSSRAEMNENDPISADANTTTVEQVQSDVVVVNQASNLTPNGANAASNSNGVAYDARPSRANPVAAPEIGQSSRDPAGDPVDGITYPDDFGDLFDNLEELEEYFTEEDFFRQLKPWIEEG